MSAAEFLDTNILLYGFDSGDLRKQQIAQQMLEQALGGTFVISTQVLGEFASVLLHKMVPPVEPTALSRILTSLGPIRTIPTDADMVLRAVDARGLYGLHFYDCLVLAAAERAGCETIWSEDLNSGQQYFGITVRNPF